MTLGHGKFGQPFWFSTPQAGSSVNVLTVAGIATVASSMGQPVMPKGLLVASPLSYSVSTSDQITVDTSYVLTGGLTCGASSMGQPTLSVSSVNVTLVAVGISGTTNTTPSQIEGYALLSGVTLGINSAADATGATAADKINETATTGGHYVYYAASAVAGHNIYWAEVKAAERTWLWIYLFGGVGSGHYVDIANKVFGSVYDTEGYDVSKTIVDLGSGWIRVEVVYDYSADDSPTLYIGPATGDSAPVTYAGTAGSGILVGKVGLAPGSTVDLRSIASASLGQPTFTSPAGGITATSITTRSAGIGMGNNLVPAFPS